MQLPLGYAHFYIAILIVAVDFAIAQIRQSLRDGEPLGVIPQMLTRLFSSRLPTFRITMERHTESLIAEGMTQPDSIVVPMGDLTEAVTTNTKRLTKLYLATSIACSLC